MNQPKSNAPLLALSDQRGFSLLELMMAIVVIVTLSSVLMPTYLQLKDRSRDAYRKEDMAQIRLALKRFEDQYGQMPGNYNCGGSLCAGGGGYGACEGQEGGYERSMQQVVNAGFLPAVPRDPSFPDNVYCYFDYGSGNTVGALLVTNLEAVDPNAGLPGSCRPFSAGTNWCSKSLNVNFCQCLSY